MAHWSNSRPTLPTASSRCRKMQRRDWYSVSVDLQTTPRMHSSASISCECPKGLLILQNRRADLSGYPWRCPAVPTCTAIYADRRHPVSTKTAVFFIRRSTRSCCLTAYYWTSHLPCHMERPTCRCHLSNISAQLQKTTKTASVSTFIPWSLTVSLCGPCGSSLLLRLP